MQMALADLAVRLQDGTQPKPEAVSDILREAILRGVYPGGTPLRQEDLAAQLGVSRMPIRDALKQLETEGFVLSMPHKGAVVAHLSAAEAQELGELRLALEPLLLRHAVARLSKGQLGQAEDLLDQADAETDEANWSSLNWAFHTTLYQAAGRPRILGIVRGTHRNVDRYMRLTLSALHHQAQSQQEHRAILAACQARDSGQACALLETHIATSSADLVHYLEERQAAEGEKMEMAER